MTEQIFPTSIQRVLPKRFLDYAIAVLKDRAIPDGFDGLKPIHRRVLLAMHDLNLTSKAPYRKCAKTIGEVLGKYHPHGDQSAYEALVGLAQDFNMRYPLIDGSGNFGSINDDPAAAMRYTEARLSPFGELMLEGVENLSPTKDNFDNSAKEAITLASYFPNLLLNPTNGIAVGLATKFAPHYARDVYTALIQAITLEAQGDKITLEQLIELIKAPDFPTGAQIINAEAVKNIYRTGKGAVVLRAKYRMEKNNLVYYEIPYKTVPKKILERIESFNLEGIREVRDETSLQTGLRLVVELKKDTNVDYIVNFLFKHTDLQCSYHVNMAAIFDNRPNDNLSLDYIIEYYLLHLKQVHRRALENQQKELERNLFRVNTMLKAIDLIDEIVRIVRYEDEPVLEMQRQLGFTKEEAEYIYEIKLSAISKANKRDLDGKKEAYEQELAGVLQLLGNNVDFLQDLAAKLTGIRDGKLFKGDVRRTEILDVFDPDDDPLKYVEKEPVVISIIKYGNVELVRATKPVDYKVTGRKTMGTKVKLRENEFIIETLSLTTHDNLLLFSNLGKAYILPVYKLPIVAKDGKGSAITNYLTLENEENIIAIEAVPQEIEDLSAVFVTSKGFIKRTSIELLTRSRSSKAGSKAIGLSEGDKIAAVAICHSNADICIFTNHGRGLKFNIDEPQREVRASGKTAKGVLALKLEQDELVVAAARLEDNSSLLIMTDKGWGKRLNKKNIKDQKRNQVPLNYMAKSKELGNIVAVLAVKGDDDILVMTKQGQTVRLSVDAFKAVGKTARGLMMLNIKAQDDKVVSMSKVAQDPAEE